MDLQTIIGQLFSLDPSRAPTTLRGPQMAGGQAPAAPAKPDPLVDDSPQGKVLATLRDRSAANFKPARGPLGLPTGPLPDVKGKSRGSAFATGLAAGMNNAQNAATADNKAQTDAAATNLKTMSALFTAQEQSRANDIREKNAAALQDYYKGIVANGAAKANATSPKDVAANEHTIEMTKRSAATRFGLNSPQLAKDMGSPIPSVKAAAEAEYKRRKEGYDAWERSFNGRVGAGADPVDAAVGAHIKTGTDGAPDAGGGPATPPADPATGKPAPPPKGAPAAATPAPATPAPAAPDAPTPETWKPIRNSKDGSMWLWNPATGEKKPMPGNPPPPSPSFPDPISGDEPAPAQPAPTDDDDSE